MQSVIATSDAATELTRLCAAIAPDRIYVLTDDNTHRLCMPLLSSCEMLKGAQEIVIRPSDTHKTLCTLADVWTALSSSKATRRSLLVNLGGGMVSDLGGFAAATFKRGIRFIHIPTTLLAMVDAAVGGKTGINLNELKNEVGCFCESSAVLIDTRFLQTLDAENLKSGFAEMLKHALLEDVEMWAEHLNFDLTSPDYRVLQAMVAKSIAVKQRIVAADPYEHGLRKALNLGHTFGHAFESFALAQSRPVLHGYAVAWGLVCELYLSAVLIHFPTEKMRQTVNFIRDFYGSFPFTCKDYPYLYELMLHDKKNSDGCINFTLLGEIGDIRLNCRTNRETVYESFDFLREG